MSTLHSLISLQQLDTKILTGKAKLGQLMLAQKESDALIALRQTMETAGEAAAKKRTTVKSTELELGTLTDKLNQAQQRLYSGKERNPKALQDLQSEERSLNGRRDTLEEALMEQMVELETLETSATNAKDAYETAFAQFSTEKEAYKEESVGLANELNQQLAQRKTQIAKLDQSTQQRYTKLFKTKKGLAVAQVKRGLCQGCRVAVNNNLLKQVERGEIVNCTNCGRILYI